VGPIEASESPHAGTVDGSGGSFRRNRVLLLLTAVYLLNYLDRQVLVILAEPIKREFALQDWQIGFLAGPAFALFYATLGIPVARMADRANRVDIIAVSLATWSAMTMLCASATSFVQLALARTGVGIGEAGGSPPAVSLLASYFPPARLSTAMSVYSSGATLGILAGFVIAGWVNAEHGWRVAMIVAGAPGIALAILVKLAVKDPRVPRELPADTDSSRSVAASFRTLMASSRCRWINAAAVWAAVAVYGFMGWMPAYLMRSFDVSTREVGTALGLIAGIAGSAGVFAGGWFADRAAASSARRQFLVPAVTTAMFPVVAILALQARDWTTALVWLAPAYALCLAYTGPTWAALQTAVPQHMRAMAAALLLFLVNLVGLGLGPQLVGVASDLFADAGVDGLRSAIGGICCFSVVAAACFLRCARSG